MHVWPKKRLRRCYVLADVIIFVCEVPCIFWHYINVDEVSWIAQKIITKCDGIITNCDSLVYYKVQWTVITNCDSFFITNCDTVYYKLWQVLQSAMDLLQIATGITKCDDYYKLRQYGGGGIFSLHEFFFSLTACAGIFFSGKPLCTNFFFQTNIAFFWTVKSWFIIYVFVLYKLFYTHNRSKDTGHFNAKSFRKCTHSERGGSHLEWTASLCIFSVPALWNSSPTAHHNDAILHSPMKTILCGS